MNEYYARVVVIYCVQNVLVSSYILHFFYALTFQVSPCHHLLVSQSLNAKKILMLTLDIIAISCINYIGYDWILPLLSTAQLCKAHQKSWDEMTTYNLDKFLEKCDISTAMRKSTAGTLQHSDIIDCYRPHCDPDNDQYTTKQCSYLHPEWCWCSSPDGYEIPDTFQKNMPQNYCCK